MLTWLTEKSLDFLTHSIKSEGTSCDLDLQRDFLCPCDDGHCHSFVTLLLLHHHLFLKSLNIPFSLTSSNLHDTTLIVRTVWEYMCMGALLVKQIGPYENDVLIKVDAFPGET